jgi:hypothetical protein
VARRRADTPLAIVVMGIFTVVLFGGGVIYYSSKTPALQLVPKLEERYAREGFATKFIPGRPPSIEVQAPPEAAPDDAALAEVAAFALSAYRELAGSTTQVTSCVALVKGSSRRAQVTLELARDLLRARDGLVAMQASATRVGLTNPEVTLGGVSRSGAIVRVTARTQRSDAATLADRTVAALSSFAYVGRIEVTLHGPDGPVERRGGPDGR